MIDNKQKAILRIEKEINPRIDELKLQLKGLINIREKIAKKYRIKTDTNPIYLSEILNCVCEVVGASVEDAKSKYNLRPTPDARKIYSLICKEFTDYSITKIGQEINRSHSTINVQLSVGSDMLEYNKRFKMNYDNAIKKVQELTP